MLKKTIISVISLCLNNRYAFDVKVFRGANFVFEMILSGFHQYNTGPSFHLLR